MDPRRRFYPFGPLFIKNDIGLLGSEGRALQGVESRGRQSGDDQAVACNYIISARAKDVCSAEFVQNLKLFNSFKIH